MSSLNTEIVGTYNMSWASDALSTNAESTLEQIKPKASEYSFLLQNNDIEKNPRALWENAKSHLLNFISTKTPVAVGLQEMNITDNSTDGVEGTLTSSIINTTNGTGSIAKVLPSDYKLISGLVQSTFGNGRIAADVGISIIINTRIAGNPNKSKVIDNLNQTGFVSGGRPILMVYTDKNYLFVNMHGAQNPALGTQKTGFNDYMDTNNKEKLQNEVKVFIETNSINPNPLKIYIMGDFNDRYDAIKEFKIGEKIIKYNGPSPKSCCHNWDSSAVEKRREQLEKQGEDTEDYFYGKQPTLEDSTYAGNFDGDKFNPKTKIPDEDVKISNYLYKGDKVFSNNPGPLKIYTGDEDETSYFNKISNKSDHELVYMESPQPTMGGKKHRNTKKRSKKHRKQKRKSRRYRK